MNRLSRLALSFALAAFVLPAAAAELTVMSFNVRTLNAQDGPNAWDKRRDLFVDTIRQVHPDVMGTQELFKRQADDTVAKLPEYAWFGRDRFGKHDEEHMGIFYRKDRLKLVDSGDFWLSDTPDKVGSITWGNVFPRMVNWGLFERLDDHRRFYLLDTHFPYRDQDEDARTRSAKEIAAWIAKLPADVPVIFTGDFNTEPSSQAHAILTATLKDAWQTAPKQEGPAKTFHDFTGRATSQIDWILYRGVKPAWVRTVTTSKDGRYPSDHFPVAAEFAM